MSKVCLWIKSNYKWIIGTVIVVSMVLCLFWFRDDLKELEIVKRKIDIAKKKRDIEVLTIKKDELSKSREKNKEQIKVIEDQIKLAKVEAAKKRAEVIKLSLNQKLDDLDKLGY